jgi:hypothetical protein
MDIDWLRTEIKRIEEELRRDPYGEQSGPLWKELEEHKDDLERQERWLVKEAPWI